MKSLSKEYYHRQQQHPSAFPSQTISLKILTYNVNGLKYINRDRLRKLRSIAAFIAAGHYDLVALQEVFCAQDAQLFASRLKPSLPYSHWFTNTSVVGSPGLMTLSRYPLTAIHQRTFSLQGSPMKFYRGDWFAGKGVGYVRVVVSVGSREDHPSNINAKNKSNGLFETVRSNQLTVHFFNTHLLANYGYESPRESQFAVHRLAQMYELAAYVESIIGVTIGHSLPPDNLLLLAGDLNTRLTDPGYDLLSSRLALFDCHLCQQRTCSCYKSSNRRFPEGLEAGGCPRAHKIDYVFLRLGSNLSSLIDVYRENGLSKEVRNVDDTSEGEAVEKAEPMSDHLPVSVRVVLTAGGSSDGGHTNHTISARTAMGECSQSACLQYTCRLLTEYLNEQAHRGLLFAFLINFFAIFAFTISLFAASLQPLEAILLLFLYILTVYIIVLIKMAAINSEYKGLSTILTMIRFDLDRYTSRHDILLLGGEP